jgi:hypothetical protein
LTAGAPILKHCGRLWHTSLEGGLLALVRYRVDTPHVIHQTIDSEVIMIDLRSGAYYSLQAGGAEIWNELQDSPALEDIVAALAVNHVEPRQELEEVVGAFLQELERNQLVVSFVADGVLSPRPRSPEQRSTRTNLEPPVLERFDDMQDLILLDPVHEVDEDAGWPHMKPGATLDAGVD